ncbi:hypothetical protein BC936DRAFT_142218, partial [Jimgerdemannia flammicorona]
GITEYLFRSPHLLEEALKAALHNREIRVSDMEFMTAARGWAECVELGNMEGYRKRFEATAGFFSDRFAESAMLGNKMIAMITKKTVGRKGATGKEEGRGLHRSSKSRKEDRVSVSASHIPTLTFMLQDIAPSQMRSTARVHAKGYLSRDWLSNDTASHEGTTIEPAGRSFPRCVYSDM